MSSLHCVEEDSGLDAVAHLALARRQNQKEHFGITKDETVAYAAVFFVK